MPYPDPTVCWVCQAPVTGTGGQISATAAWHDPYVFAFCQRHYVIASLEIGMLMTRLRGQSQAADERVTLSALQTGLHMGEKELRGRVTTFGPFSVPKSDEPVVDSDARRRVYCTYCLKTHAVRPEETPCAPGAWLDPEPERRSSTTPPSRAGLEKEKE